MDNGESEDNRELSSGRRRRRRRKTAQGASVQAYVNILEENRRD